MNIETLESEIVAHLQALSVEDSIDVVAVAESESDFKRNVNDARIVVGFNGFDWDESKATDKVTQGAVATIGVVIQARLLRGELGVYALFNSVRKHLVGFAPTGFERLTINSFDLFSDEDEVFTFVAFFKCNSTTVENYTEPDGPLISKMTVENDTLFVPPVIVEKPESEE